MRYSLFFVCATLSKHNTYINRVQLANCDSKLDAPLTPDKVACDSITERANLKVPCRPLAWGVPPKWSQFVKLICASHPYDTNGKDRNKSVLDAHLITKL